MSLMHIPPDLLTLMCKSVLFGGEILFTHMFVDISLCALTVYQTLLVLLKLL